MPFLESDTMPLEDCDKLKDEVEIFMHQKRLTFFHLSRRANVLPSLMEAWLKGHRPRLPVVDFGKIYITIHPDSEAGK